MLIDMFLQMQGRFDELDSELKKANDNTQKILEQLVLAKKARFGRSSEKMVYAQSWVPVWHQD